MDPRSENTLNRLLRGLMVSLAQVEHNGPLTVRQLCDKSGVARSSFYKYFEDLPDFYVRGLNMILHEVEQKMHTPPKNLKEIQFNISLLVRIVSENKRFFKEILTVPDYSSLKLVLMEKVRLIIKAKMETRKQLAIQWPEDFSFLLDLLVATVREYLEAIAGDRGDPVVLTRLFFEFTQFGSSRWLTPIGLEAFQGKKPEEFPVFSDSDFKGVLIQSSQD